MHDPANSIDYSNHIATGVPTEDQDEAPPSSPTTSCALEGSGSKSPLKVPQGVIVRTPSGKDSQGRKTPPRFFTITNQQLQQMQHSTGSTEPIGPKHFKFKDANQTVDRERECSCTNSPRKTETGHNPKATRDCPEKIGVTVTLKSLLEAEIRRSNLMQTSKVQQGDTRTERKKEAHPPSSPISSPRGRFSSHVESSTKNHKEITTTASLLSGERREAPHVTAKTKTTGNKPTTTLSLSSEILDRNITPKPPTPKCKSRGPSLDYFEHHLPTSDNKVPKGSLLDMMLSSTELFDNDRMSKLGITSLGKDNPGRNTRTAAVTGDRKSAMDGKTSDERNPPLSTRIDASNCTSNGLHELESTNSKWQVDNRLSHGAGGIITSGNSKEQTQNAIPIPEAHTEYVPILKSKDVGVSDDPCKEVKSKFSLNTSTPSNSNQLQIKTSGTTIIPKASVVPVSSLQVMEPLRTQSEKPDVPHSFKTSSTRVDIAELPSTSYMKNVSGTLGGKSEIKKDDHKMNTFDSFQKTPKQSKLMGNNITPVQELRAKCAPKTTLIINSVMSTSVTASSCSSGSSGQLYGLVRSVNNPTGPMVLVALGTRPQSSNESTTLTASGNHLNSVKPGQSCTPVVINNLSSTGNVNTDSFNVWKSYVRKAYQDKYGANCDYYMHNQWVSMSVAEKSPFVHQARNRSQPPVVVQTSTSIPNVTTKDVRKSPAVKNSNPVIQRQINVIPKLQTTAPDRPIADFPLSMNEQDILKELYRSTNMAGLSPDFPMATINNRMMKGSGNILTDPASSLDPLFAQCLLSGRRYDIDNWIAMKTNWRVTPEWIVDFLAEYDERKRARRAAIDAGVMRRVAMAQRMARMEHDDENDDHAGTSTATVQTPQKHSGKRYQQESDSKEDTPTCHDKTQQSVSTVGRGPTEGVHNRKDKYLAPTKTPIVTRTPSRGLGLVPPDSHDQMTSSCGVNSPHNAYQHSSNLKPSNLHRVVPPMTPTSPFPRGSSMVSLPTGQDKGLPGQISTQNVDNNSFSQRDGGYSQNENVLGDLDLIDDEELWNIQCSLFPPWQRVQSFIDSDAADDFFKDLDKVSRCLSDAPSLTPVSCAEQLENVEEDITSQPDIPVDAVYQTERGKHCPEALQIMSSLSKEITPSEESRSIVSSAITHIEQDKMNTKNPTNVKRCLFSDPSVKNARQPKDNGPTEKMKPLISKTTDAHEEMNSGDGLGVIIESTNMDVALGNGSQSTDPLGRRKEEDVAASKLLELLNKTHQPLLSEHVETKDIVIIQDNTSEDGRASEENILKDVFSGISDTVNDIRGKTRVTSSQMTDGMAEWHEEIKPMIAMSEEPFPAASLVTDVLEPLPVEKTWNNMTRANYNNNMYGSDGKNEHSNQFGNQRDIVNETNHDPIVDAGSPELGGSVSQISKNKADTKDHSRDIEKWHEEIQPIIALAVNSSSSSSVENEVRRTHSEDDQRITPTVELQENTECDKTEPLKDNDKIFIEEELKAIPTVASSSGEYLTADETELYSIRSNDVRTPDHCPTAEPLISPGASESLFSEIAHSSITSDLSNLPVSEDIPTTSGNVESDIADEETHQTICSEAKKTCGSAPPRCHDRRRKKRRQDAFLDDSRETNLETSIPVAQSSSESSLTSAASSSSSSSSSLISTRRKSRGKKRKRKTGRPQKKPNRKTKRDGCSPSKSHPLGPSVLHPDDGKNDSEGDAPANSSKTKSGKRSSRTTTAKSSKHDSPKQKDDGDRSLEPHDVRRMDHEGDDGSSDDSRDEFVIADKSPTSLKKKRKSSRLRIRRVSKLPRLRSKRHGSVSFQTKPSNMSKVSVHGKVNKTGRRGSRNK